MQLDCVALWVVSCLTVGLLQTEQLTNGYHWKGGHTVTEARVFDINYIFPLPTIVVAEVNGLY